jgi:hypothetical protein
MVRAVQEVLEKFVLFRYRNTATSNVVTLLSKRPFLPLLPLHTTPHPRTSCTRRPEKVWRTNGSMFPLSRSELTSPPLCLWEVPGVGKSYAAILWIQHRTAPFSSALFCYSPKADTSMSVFDNLGFAALPDAGSFAAVTDLQMDNIALQVSTVLLCTDLECRCLLTMAYV